MANSQGWFDPSLYSTLDWFDESTQNLGWFDEELRDSSFPVITQAGFKSRPVGGLRRMGANGGGGGPVLARAYWLPLLGVA